MKSLLIGAVSANYKPSDVRRWIETSRGWDGCERILLMYNGESNPDLANYIRQNDIRVIVPTDDVWGRENVTFEPDTGKCNVQSSYTLVHNIRFYHIWKLLSEETFDKVLITDVRDVYFNRNPFPQMDDEKLTVTSEEITYSSEAWNRDHLHYNTGIIGLTQNLDKQVYNVGVFGGPASLVRRICADVYLISAGKHYVADQTSFNYLIHSESYRDKVKFTGLTDEFAVHLHVVNAGLVQFDYRNQSKYAVVHQWDRIVDWDRRIG